jgi:uncharacterized protein
VPRRHFDQEEYGRAEPDWFTRRILVSLASTALLAFSSNLEPGWKDFMTPLSIRMILRAILEEYVLPWGGDHGIAHWARVLENGLKLAEETGADPEVVQLFAILHDSKRINEGGDPKHGPRAAAYASELRGLVFDLPDPAFRLLQRACAGHTHERTHPDITIQTCWDADRLDLGRVGITPHPSRLCTEVAKRPEMIKWADDRATLGVVPEIVTRDWAIDTSKSRQR